MCIRDRFRTVSLPLKLGDGRLKMSQYFKFILHNTTEPLMYFWLELGPLRASWKINKFKFQSGINLSVVRHLEFDRKRILNISPLPRMVHQRTKVKQNWSIRRWITDNSTNCWSTLLGRPQPWERPWPCSNSWMDQAVSHSRRSWTNLFIYLLCKSYQRTRKK